MSLNTEDQQYKINLSINADEDIEVDDQREQTVVGDPIYKDSVTYDVALKPTFSGVKDEDDDGHDRRDDEDADKHHLAHLCLPPAAPQDWGVRGAWMQACASVSVFA